MSEAARDNTGKPMLSFILQFPTAIAALARVKEIGAIKYLRDDWKKGGKPDWEYLDAAMRHLEAFTNGETFASDTGCTHLGHAMWNIMALQDLNYKGVTHDPELFSAMCEYWRDRREAEAKGFTFPTVEEWVAGRRELETQGPGEEDGSWAKGWAERYAAATLDAMAKGLEIEKDFEEPVGPAVDKINVSKPMRSIVMHVPGLSKTHYFDKPLTCQSGQTITINEEMGIAMVIDEYGVPIESASLAPPDERPESPEFHLDQCDSGDCECNR